MHFSPQNIHKVCCLEQTEIQCVKFALDHANIVCYKKTEQTYEKEKEKV